MGHQIKFNHKQLVTAKTKPVEKAKQRSKYKPHVGKKEINKILP